MVKTNKTQIVLNLMFNVYSFLTNFSPLYFFLSVFYCLGNISLAKEVVNS